jgi:restriction endonuclease S subunit
LNFNYIYDNLFTGQGLKNLTGQGLKKLKIPVPSLEEQERIVKEIEELDNQDNYYKKGIDSMKTMINTIYTSINTIVNS